MAGKTRVAKYIVHLKSYFIFITTYSLIIEGQPTYGR